MADAPSAMIDFLMRTVTKLEADNAKKAQRIRDLEAFLEPMREAYEEGAGDAARYLELMASSGQED